jgi:hypothetical protein
LVVNPITGGGAVESNILAREERRRFADFVARFRFAPDRFKKFRRAALSKFVV